MSRLIFLDTETTGLSAAEGDRVIEIGCVEILDRRPTERNFHVYLNPERDSHPDALAIHGLTSEFLADKPSFASIAPQLLDYLAGADVYIHNAAFDLGFLDAELARLKLPPLAQHLNSVHDTWVMAKTLYPGQQNNLDALCRRLDVDNSNRSLHGALLDARLLADVYIGMTRGQNSLLGEGGSAEETSASARQNLSGFDLPILLANADELQAHQRVLSDIGKKATVVWA